MKHRPTLRKYNQFTHPVRFTVRQLIMTMRNAQEFRNWRTVNECRREIKGLYPKREPINA